MVRGELAGTSMTVGGFIMAFVGLWLGGACSAACYGGCYGLSGLGNGLALLGGTLFVAGLVVLIASLFMKSLPSRASPADQLGPPCSVCSAPLSFVQAHNRWYCSRCGQYR